MAGRKKPTIDDDLHAADLNGDGHISLEELEAHIEILEQQLELYYAE